MRLAYLSEDGLSSSGHWTPWPGHPGSTAKRHSPLLDPSDREKFFGGVVVGKKKKRKKKISEATWSLKDELNQLRPQMAEAAQEAYNNRDSDEMGICDEVASQLAGVIYNHIADVEVEDGGHEGDDHAYLYVWRDPEKYLVDIPHHLYERGGGYNWTILPDVVFQPDDIVIEPLH